MNTKIAPLDAFRWSWKGKLLAATELGILTSILALLMTYFMFPLLGTKPAGNFELCFMSGVGLFMGAFLGFPTGICFFSDRLFPPNEEVVSRYREWYKKDLINKISYKENYIQEYENEAKQEIATQKEKLAALRKELVEIA